ncbi:MAG: Molybdopterin oxidoreductase subunit, predicted; chaperone protein HtpG [uncultured Aureispira sp.]|uniref:Molybdopterin oxidoreductase subunit, predicted chaperone protein HtpG n=1 Tax=uncultured Aureispira sp. TaxID=1331704 RepID=A0A6S6S2R4_9BACT|nr:MAG: Molybdopterin oxidoreductase subunit, predicted; chaperone protein HtpG [uncultured Aureispira sp.]
MIYQRLLSFCAITLLIVMLPNWSMAADAVNGKSLFLEKCASCHNINMVSDMTGPALQTAQENWAEYPGAIYEWIRNSEGLAASGNPRAIQMVEWSPSAMTAFENLKDAQIDDILEFVKEKSSAKASGATGTTEDTKITKSESESSPWLGYSLVAVLLLAIALLGRYINSLTRLSQQQAGAVVTAEKSILGVLLGPSVVKLLIFVAVLFGGYTTVNNAIDMGRQQDYAPEQPINFSHKIHSGDNGIDCQYCHDGARRSKHSVIPASNTCINCHANIQKGSKDGTKELIKVYAASGFNPLSNSYLPEDMSGEERANVYKKWLRKTYNKEWKENETTVNKMIDEQLASIKGTYSKPIEWVRVHNLPDHVYFNHAQHVTVGKVKCETCHGEVAEMDVVKQHSPLSMGWCINCHRQTEVQFKDGLNEGKNSPYDGKKNKANAYYTDYKYYEQYHKELDDKKRKGVTVEEIGGLECQKCHY